MSNITIFDGPIGTALFAHGMPTGENPELWTLAHPEVLSDIQHGYVRAGAQAVMAPTFGASQVKLGARAAAVNTALVALTRANVGSGVAVGGDLSPLGLFVPPFGDTGFDEMIALYTVQAQALANAGVDFFCIETQMNLFEARAAILAVQSCSQKPIWVSFTCDEQGKTLSGADIEAALVTVQALGIDVFGLNCVTTDPLPLYTRLRRFARVPLLYKPNAGLPDEQLCYHVSPAELTAPLPALTALGVTHFGGCCGCTADHLAAMSEVLRGIESADPCPAYADGVTADSRRVYLADAPDGDYFTVTDNASLATLAEEQFLCEGPAVIATHPDKKAAVQKNYHGIPRFR